MPNTDNPTGIEYIVDTPLARRRREMGITQKQLADRCHLYSNTLALYERGERFPRREHLRSLSHQTGLTFEQLLFPEEYLTEHPEFLRMFAQDTSRRTKG